MDINKKSISERIVTNLEKEISGWNRSLELAAGTMSLQSTRVSNELYHCSDTWQTIYARIKRALKDKEELEFAQVDKVLKVLPPQRSILRLHLERMTRHYDEICLERGLEIGELFAQAEAAIERGTVDIGINLLDHLLKQDGRFYPGIIMRAVLMFPTPSERGNAIRLLDRAIGLIPGKFTDRYKIFTLELLAHAFEIDGKSLNAIKTLKRVKNLSGDIPIVNYDIARNYCLCRQYDEVMPYLEMAAEGRPELLALSLIDKDFAGIKSTLFDFLEEKNEWWGEKSLGYLKESKKIIDIAEDYELSRLDDTIAEGIDAFKEMDKKLDEGCYSVYRNLLTFNLPIWIQDFPARVTSRLGRIVQKQMNEIEQHNKELKSNFAKRRGSFLKIGVPLWVGFSFVVLITLVINGHNPFSALFFALVIVGIGYVPVRIVDSLLKKEVEEKRIYPDAAGELQMDIRQVEGLKNDISIKMRQEGFVLSKDLSKV